jgi:hypothetical protein
MEQELFQQIVLQQIFTMRNRLSKIRDKMADMKEAKVLKLKQEELYLVQRKFETEFKDTCITVGEITKTLNSSIGDKIDVIYHDLSEGK